MADYTLHCFAQSGNAYKAAIMLELAGADWQAQWVDFFNGGARSPEYLALNNMGEVPVLVDHTEGDLALSQSGVILHHLAEKLGKFGGETKNDHREILRWILFDNHKLTGNLATYRFLSHFMKKDDESPEVAFLKGRTIAAIKVLNRHLDGREWVVGDSPTIADFSLCGYLFWPDEFGVDWKDYPGIEAWLGRISALPGWKAPYDLMPSE